MRIEPRKDGYIAIAMNSVSKLAGLIGSCLCRRYGGFLAVQGRAGELIHGWLTDGGPPDPLLDRLDALYREAPPPGEG